MLAIAKEWLRIAPALKIRIPIEIPKIGRFVEATELAPDPEITYIHKVNSLKINCLSATRAPGSPKWRVLDPSEWARSQSRPKIAFQQ